MNRITLLTVLLSAFLLTLIACEREEIPTVDPDTSTPITSMEDIKADHSFSWSASQTGNLNVHIQANPDIATEGEMLLLLNENKEILSRSLIRSGVASYTLKLPNEIDQLSLFYPNTGIYQPLNSTEGSVQFAVQLPYREEANKAQARYLPDMKRQYEFFKPSKNAAKSTNLFVNSYFDVNDLSRNNKNYNKLRNTGKWYYRDGNNISTSTVNGNKVFKNLRNSQQELVQSISASANTEYNIRMYYSGSVDLFADEFNSSSSWLKYTNISTPGSQNSISTNIITSSQCSYLQLFIEIDKNAYVDSVVVSEVPSIVDADNDGVADQLDDYPNDGSRAYRIMYPTSGYQTLSFEDLWPSKGDYDFNDIIISTKMEFAQNASGDLVWAKGYVSLDACGSSLPSGLGVHFLTQNKTAISTQKISSVSGHASIDSDINNGIIVYTNHFDEQTVYYSNTGNGHNSTPEEFNFEVFFTSGLSDNKYIPDYYYFRNDDRSHEIHQPTFPPTSMAGSALFGTMDDDINQPYSTSDGLPWGIEVVTINKSFKHPKEKKGICEAYTQFGQWANSNGVNYKTWYNTYNNSMVFTWNSK